MGGSINTISYVAQPVNEPVLNYAPGSPERAQIRSALTALASERREICSIVNGEELRGETRLDVCSPHRRHDKIATLLQGGSREVEAAINAAQKARASWSAMSFEDRAAIFLRAAEFIAGRYRARINAATMLGQSKTAHQAEIDSACELIDFLRFNVYFARRMLEEQPISGAGMRNMVDYRPLDGFVLAVSPFNFTAIAGNLPTAPALLGNTVVWKPATTAVLSNQIIMDILMEAGLPPGVINLVHAPGRVLGDIALKHPSLAGVHFTGSTSTFQSMWKTVGENISQYQTYPRLVGETGGKDFIIAHASADVDALATAIVRGAFEYQGQKCSAASRVYVPQSMWKELSGKIESAVSTLKVGDVANFENFMGAVIDHASFQKIQGYIEYAKTNGKGKVWLGGGCNDKEGYFIQPTVVLADDPKHKLLCEEIFGPVLTIYPYADNGSPKNAFADVLKLCDETSPYALTGAIFARDRQAICEAQDALRFAAGNFYINDKPTGAVVGQQPFGGGRASGTNDKAGSMMNLLRWTSMRAIKENFDPPRSVPYPYMASEK